MDCYEEEKLDTDGKDDTRVVIHFPFELAPVKYAILPLIKKDKGMVELGEKIYHQLRKQYNCEFDL